MKKIYSSKFPYLLMTLFVFSAESQINLKIDRDLTSNNESIVPVIPLKGNTAYQLSGSQITLQSANAMICNRIEGYQPSSTLKVRVVDPNGDNKGDNISLQEVALKGVQNNINYNIGRKTLNVTSQNRSKTLCLSADDFDVIYHDGFSLDAGVQPESSVVYNLTNEPVNGYESGDIMAYEVLYENTTGASQLLDFMEYYPYTSNSDAYFNKGGNVSCQILDENDLVVSGSFCVAANGVVHDVDLLPNHKIKLTISRVISTSVKADSKLQMMAAVFTKVVTIDGPDSIDNHSFSSFASQRLIVPVDQN